QIQIGADGDGAQIVVIRECGRREILNRDSGLGSDVKGETGEGGKEALGNLLAPKGVARAKRQSVIKAGGLNISPENGVGEVRSINCREDDKVGAGQSADKNLRVRPRAANSNSGPVTQRGGDVVRKGDNG